MSINNPKHYRALELKKVLELLKEQAGTEEGKERAEKVAFSSDFEEVKKSLEETDDGVKIVSRYGAPNIRNIKNLEEPIKRSEVGGVLSMGEILEVGKLLREVIRISEFREKIEVETSINYLFENLQPNKAFEADISRSIEAEDKMSDQASSELANIRRKIRSTQSKIRSLLDDMVSSQTTSKYLQDPIISMRDGRYVIPVKQEYRGQVKGVVHGTSATGATLFVEPIKVVDANNDISILKGKEEEEIYRVLTVFSQEIANIAYELRINYENLINMDLLFAKAKLGIKMDGISPELNQEGKIDLKGARHPLINRNQVVAIDIRLGTDFDTLMITGPNTGGKTVALKTLGLLTLMAMCGLLIPVKQGSQVSIFDQVLADIGEEQSIEQSLSTFSAHITHVIEILKIANEKTLVLFDELGAGTDPVEGAALAMAIVEEVRSLGCKVALTTHYAELKVYALNTAGVTNASCEFDVISLKPTYKLLIGTPGRSNAFAIAEKLGISKKIIENAKLVVNKEKANFEEVVSTLETQRQSLEKEYSLAKVEKEEAKKARLSMEDELNKELSIKKREIEKAKEQAQGIIIRTQYQANRLLKELEELKKNQEKESFSYSVSKAKSDITNILSSMGEKSQSLKAVEENYTLPRKLVIGDVVKIPSLNATGTVLNIDEKTGKVSVQAGIIKTEVGISSLRLVEEKEKVSFNNSSKGYARVKRSKNSDRTLEVDIRGQNLEEGLMNLDQFIDNSVLSKYNIIMIIHGKGTGVLRDGVREHLKRHRNIKSFRPGAYGEGEDGVTVAELR